MVESQKIQEFLHFAKEVFPWEELQRRLDTKGLGIAHSSCSSSCGLLLGPYVRVTRHLPVKSYV